MLGVVLFGVAAIVVPNAWVAGVSLVACLACLTAFVLERKKR